MPSSKDPTNPGIKPRSPALQADCLLSEPPGILKTSLGQLEKEDVYSVILYFEGICV